MVEQLNPPSNPTPVEAELSSLLPGGGEEEGALFRGCTPHCGCLVEDNGVVCCFPQFQDQLASLLLLRLVAVLEAACKKGELVRREEGGVSAGVDLSEPVTRRQHFLS